MESNPNINNELTSPNLRSLKRPQLIKLAKANGIPGNGKVCHIFYNIVKEGKKERHHSTSL